MASNSSRDDGRLHLRIDPALKGWLHAYVEEKKRQGHRTLSMTLVIEDLLTKLRAQVEEPVDAEQL